MSIVYCACWHCINDMCLCVHMYVCMYMISAFSVACQSGSPMEWFMDLDLPEQHPVLDDSDVTLRWKKSKYRLERASLADRFLPSSYLPFYTY